jgi:electron transfer flavoprotein beta subunit
MLSIVVCVKMVIDPEMPFSVFKVDREARKPIPPVGMPPVISPFDENALEAALRIKDRQESRVVVLSLGKAVPKALLQRALAMGADEAIAIEDTEFENLDPFDTAAALASGVKKVGRYDLVFTGRQAADWDAGVVWAGIAELLDLPSITMACKAEVNDGRVTVERCGPDGIDILESDMPALITFSTEVGLSRHVSLQALMKAMKRSITKWSASDLESGKSELMELIDLYEPDLGLVNCSLMPGDTPEERGRNLARELVSQGLLRS